MLALTMLLTALPAQAASSLDVPKRVTPTIYPSETYITGGRTNKMRYLYLVPSKVKALKSSKKSVATVTQSKDGTNGYYIRMNLKKAGTTTVSFKYKSKTYKTKVIVKKYVNPVSSIKIGNTTLPSSKFKTGTGVSLKYSKFANKKVKVTINLKPGWETDSGSSIRNANGTLVPIPGFSYIQKGWRTSRTALWDNSTIKIKGGKGFTINIRAKNTKTGQGVTFPIVFK